MTSSGSMTKDDAEEVHCLLGDCDGSVTAQSPTTTPESQSPHDTDSSTHTERSDLSSDSETKNSRRVSNFDTSALLPNEQSKVTDGEDMETDALNVSFSSSFAPNSDTAALSQPTAPPIVGIVTPEQKTHLVTVDGSKSLQLPVIADLQIQEVNKSTDTTVSETPVVKRISKDISIVLKTKRSLGMNKEYRKLRKARFLEMKRGQQRKLSKPEVQEFIEHIENEFGIKKIHFFVEVNGGIGYRELTGDALYKSILADIQIDHDSRRKSIQGTSKSSKCLANLIAIKGSTFSERTRDPLKSIIFQGILRSIGDAGVRGIMSKACKTLLYDWGEKYWDYFMDDEFILDKNYKTSWTCLSALMKSTRTQLFEIRGDACKKIIFEGILNDIGLAAVDGMINDEKRKDLHVWIEKTWIFFFYNDVVKKKRKFSSISKQNGGNDSGSSGSTSSDTSEKSKGNPKNDDAYPSDQSPSGNNQEIGGRGDRYAKNSAYFGYENVEDDRSDDDSSVTDSSSVPSDSDVDDDNNDGVINLRSDHNSSFTANSYTNYGSVQEEARMAVNVSNIQRSIDQTLTTPQNINIENVVEVDLKLEEMVFRLSQHGLTINYIDDESSTLMSTSSRTDDDDFSTSSVCDDPVFYNENNAIRDTIRSECNESFNEIAGNMHCTTRIKNGEIDNAAHFAISDSDVLLGRGLYSARHIGNQMFLQKRDELYEQYIKASSSKAKRLIQAQLLISVYERNGRFLTKCQYVDTNKSHWKIETDIVTLFRRAASKLRDGRCKQKEIETISTAMPKMLPLLAESHTETSIECTGEASEENLGTQDVYTNGDSKQLQKETRPTKVSTFLPIMIHKTKLRCNDLDASGLRDQSNSFVQLVTEYRNTLCEEQHYALLKRHKEKRRVQEMLLEFIELNGGRVVKQVPDHDSFYYVMSRRNSLQFMASLLLYPHDHLTWNHDAVSVAPFAVSM